MMPTDTLTCQVTPDSVEPNSLSCSMPPLEHLELWDFFLSNAGTWVTALATIALVITAIWAGRIAVGTLRQMKADSISQTRPYVYAHLVPSIAGMGSWDLIVKNSGQSSAKELSMTCSEWPEYDDVFIQRLRSMFSTEQTIPPGVAIRTLWRSETPADQTVILGQQIMGMPKACSISVKYRGDTAKDWYTDTYSFSSEAIGLTPMPAGGPDPAPGLTAGEKSLHKMLSRIAQSIGELGR